MPDTFYLFAIARRYHHHVYAIALSTDVQYEARCRRANPDDVSGQPCVYVGMTGQTPDIRFDKHKAGWRPAGRPASESRRGNHRACRHYFHEAH